MANYANIILAKQSNIANNKPKNYANIVINKNNLDNYVVFEGGYNYLKALQEGRGVMLITAHMGNWELMAASTALKFGKPLAVVVRPLDYEPLNMIAKELRESTGNKIIEKYRCFDHKYCF